MRTLSLLSLIAAMTWQMGWQAAPVHAETLTVTPRQVADEKAASAARSRSSPFAKATP